MPDRVVFEKLVQVLVVGCVHGKIAADSCSATTLRDRRNEWIDLGMIEQVREIALIAYDRALGLELSEVSVDCCVTKRLLKQPKVGQEPGG